MKNIYEKFLNYLLIFYSFIVLGATISAGMASMATGGIHYTTILTIVLLWVSLYFYVQYLIRRMHSRER